MILAQVRMPMVVQLVRISICFDVAYFWEQKREIIILVCMFGWDFVPNGKHSVSSRGRAAAYLIESLEKLAFPGLT
jgi:hypothetical protein